MVSSGPLTSGFKAKRLLIAALIFIWVLIGAANGFSHTGRHHHRVAFLIIDADSYLVNQAVKSLKTPHDIVVQFFTQNDLQADAEARTFIAKADVIIIDVMGAELVKWLLDNIDPALHRIYALRGSRDDESLRQKGLVFDDAVKTYFSHLSVANIRNLIYCVIHREIDSQVTFEPVVKRPKLGVYHPRAPKIFPSSEQYLKWCRSRDSFHPERPWIGLMLFSACLIEGQKNPYDYLIGQLEQAGFNVMSCFGRDLEVLEKLLLDSKRESRVSLVLSFSLKFYSAINNDIRRALADLDAPVLDAINLYSGVIDRWRGDPIGIQLLEIVWTIAVPEMSGVIEPTPLSGKVRRRDEQTGKTVYIYRPIEENVRRIINRIKGWVRLKQKPASQKRVAILYYNHNQGKQNIGASYLNVFRSLKMIIARLRKEGFQVDDQFPLTEEEIKAAVLRSGRNIGSWAPGELEKMLDQGRTVRLPLATYQTWFDRLPGAFRKAVIDQWGPPAKSEIMTHDGHLIIPAVIMNNLVLLPEPARGWSDAPMKLYHDTTLYPHHQYIAAYLWLKHGFKADAMIHLGTHATHEWLPGKQAGLAPSDPPEVLLSDLPNLYPYIVDNIGEGLQAKRRGRGVVIDHLIPALKNAELYHEYAELLEMINAYNRALNLGGDTAETHLDGIKAKIRDTGIDMDFQSTGDHTHEATDSADAPPDNHRHTGEAHEHEHAYPVLSHHHTGPDDRLVIDAAFLHELEHYLLEIKSTLMPYGLHTFGQSPQGEALRDMSNAITSTHPEKTVGQVAATLTDCGPREIEHLVHGLEGRYIPAAEGNDPIRNIKSIPTGNNFYGFSPDKVPSRAAWEMGCKAADQIIAKHRHNKGEYPQKVAVVLWATETIRNEGINESTILYLLGMAPQWDRTGRISGVRVIAGSRLNRPRIDVLVNPSGLYRDLFPHLIQYIDDAIQKAAAQTDIENLIASHTADIKKRLKFQGFSEKDAAALARIRIFSEKPGSYGTGVSELTSASGFWESDADIVKVYQDRVGFAFGQGMWGRSAQTAFKQNLKSVDVAVHSRSSQLYGLLDNDDMYQYLGGLSMAVKKESGKTPDTLITDQRSPGSVAVEDLARTLGREMRVRYFNPRWIEGMKKENYAGAGEMSKFVEYLWGWQVTTPAAVDPVKWKQTYSVYVQDKYGLDLKAFFNRENPWAYQSLTSRMLEAVRKNYWKADETVQRELAVEYAVNVIEKGVACCDHTCNNPLLNQMVVNILSLPGVMAPAKVAQFKLAMEKATANPLEKQVSDRQKLQKSLTQGFEKQARPVNQATEKKTGKADQTADAPGKQTEAVEGYKLKDAATQDDSAELASSGVQWFAGLALMGIIALFLWGALRRNKR